MLTRLTIERRLAIVIALVALLVLWLSLQVPEPSSFMAVGPRTFPYILGLAMLLSAILLFILPPRSVPSTEEREAVEHTDASVIAGDPGQEGVDEPLEWRRVLLLMGLTLLYVLLFVPLGFVLSTVPFIIVSARVLGSRHLIRDIIVAIAVAVSIYYLFTQILRVGLPEIPFLGI
jgi:putative tricarboxylic transport membrane protein